LTLEPDRGKAVLVQLLLRLDSIDPNQQSGGLTPLMVVAWKGHEAVVRLLLSNDGVKPDIQARGGCTVLTLAAQNRHEEVVRLLLEQVNVDADTVLCLVLSAGHQTMLQLLWKQDGISDKS
jgi:ankyrin repeat protein